METTMSSYVFDNSGESSSERLSYLERVCDPVTISCFEKLGVAAGWTCLEIGAGAGSVANWLSARVGANGTVLVTDIDPRFLAGLARGRRNVDVCRHDIVADALPTSSFDLIHARHVFVHLPEAVATLSRLKAALKPGAWLVIEDFDVLFDRTIPFANRTKADTLNRVADCTWRLLAKRGSGMNWAIRLPLYFRELGMIEIGANANFHCVTGGSDYARFQKATFARARPEAIAAGFASAQDYETAMVLMDDPTTIYYSNPVITAWCRRLV